MWINKFCHYHFLIDNSENFYTWCCRLLSSRVTNWLIYHTAGKVFTGGEDLVTMGKLCKVLNK